MIYANALQYQVQVHYEGAPQFVPSDNNGDSYGADQLSLYPIASTTYSPQQGTWTPLSHDSFQPRSQSSTRSLGTSVVSNLFLSNQTTIRDGSYGAGRQPPRPTHYVAPTPALSLPPQSPCIQVDGQRDEIRFSRFVGQYEHEQHETVSLESPQFRK